MSLNSKLNTITDNGFNRMSLKIAKVLTDGIQDLKNGNLQKEALSKKAFPSDISLYDISGKLIPLKEILNAKYNVINFYRGGWCPYCNLELRAYDALLTEFKKAGANIIAVSPELPEYTKTTQKKNAISYPTFTDLHNDLARKLGITFKLSNPLKQEYDNFGINLRQLHGDNNNELIVPAVYLVRKDLQIIKVYLEENHMKRVEPSEVLKDLKLQKEKGLI